MQIALVLAGCLALPASAPGQVAGSAGPPRARAPGGSAGASRPAPLFPRAVGSRPAWIGEPRGPSAGRGSGRRPARLPGFWWWPGERSYAGPVGTEEGPVPVTSAEAGSVRIAPDTAAPRAPPEARVIEVPRSPGGPGQAERGCFLAVVRTTGGIDYLFQLRPPDVGARTVEGARRTIERRREDDTFRLAEPGGRRLSLPASRVEGIRFGSCAPADRARR